MPAINRYEVAVTLTLQSSFHETPHEAIAEAIAKLAVKDPALITAVTATKLPRPLVAAQDSTPQEPQP